MWSARGPVGGDASGPYLMGDVRTSITNVAIHLSHHANVFVTVQQRVFGGVLGAIATVGMRRLVSLEAGVGEYDDQTLRVLVVAWDGHMLLGHQLRKAGRRKRLGLRPCETGKADVSHGKGLVERRCDAMRCDAIMHLIE